MLAEGDRIRNRAKHIRHAGADVRIKVGGVTFTVKVNREIRKETFSSARHVHAPKYG